MDFIIRRLEPEDAPNYRDLRLEALERAPEAFGDSLEEAAERSDSFWRKALSGERAFFGAFIGDRLVATANFLQETAIKLSHRGLLLGVYVTPDARGKGLASALTDTVLDHARTRVEQVHLHVGTANHGARKIYEKAGLQLCGTTPRSLLVGGQYIDEHEMVCFFDKDQDNE